MIMMMQGKEMNTYLGRGELEVDVDVLEVRVDVLEVELGVERLELLLGVEELVETTVEGVAVEED